MPELPVVSGREVRRAFVASDCGTDPVLLSFDYSQIELRVLAHMSGDKELRRNFAESDLLLLPEAQEATWCGNRVELTRREFALLSALVENAGRVLPRERLEQALYGWNEDVESNALEVHVHNLRRKLATGFIRTVRGVGYAVD